VGAAALAGWAAGWHVYWDALVTYHLGDSGDAGRLEHIRQSLPAAANDLLPLALPALFGLWFLRGRRLELRLTLVWLAAAFAAVNVGGLYWPHYYVQLLAPLCVLAAVPIARIRVRAVGWATAAVVALPTLAFLGALAQASESGREHMIKYALGYENDEQVARYVRTHSSPRDSVYAAVSRADFYFLADRSAASPYIWAHPLNTIPGAKAQLAERLATPHRPDFVVLFQRGPLQNRDRQVGELLARYYEPVWRTPAGTTVLAEDRAR
jgi:hypothetical protein